MQDNAAAPAPQGAMLAAPAPPITATYRRQAIKLLQNNFRGISCISIAFVYDQNGHLFSPSYHVLRSVQAKDDDSLQRIKTFQPGLKIFLKAERKAKSITVTDRNLLDEIENIPELNKKAGRALVPAATGAVVAAAEEAEIIELLDDCSLGSTPKKNDKSIIDLSDSPVGSADKKVSATAAKTIECGCCFGDFPPAEIDECSALAGHHCCRGCIKRFVTEQIDGQNRTEFGCIVNCDCEGSYSMFQLSKILSPKTNRRLNDRRMRAEIEASGMTAWTCGICNHVGFLEEPLPATVFCGSEQCRLTEYCRLCKFPWHQGQTCQDSAAERERLRDPVLRAQEAMSAATIRKCPQCSTPFGKKEGCNKMTCSKCKCLSCYLCKSQIQGYAHFCNKHGCQCNKCHLWANPEEADERARRAAGRKVLADAKMSDADIKRILASTSPPRKRPAAAAGAAQAAGAAAMNEPPPVAPFMANGDAAAAQPFVAPQPVQHLGDIQRHIQHQIQQQHHDLAELQRQAEERRRQNEARLAELQRQAEERRRQAEERRRQAEARLAEYHRRAEARQD